MPPDTAAGIEKATRHTRCQREFAFKHMPDDELFKVVDTIYKVMPGVRMFRKVVIILIAPRIELAPDK